MNLTKIGYVNDWGFFIAWELPVSTGIRGPFYKGCSQAFSLWELLAEKVDAYKLLSITARGVAKLVVCRVAVLLKYSWDNGRECC